MSLCSVPLSGFPSEERVLSWSAKHYVMGTAHSTSQTHLLPLSQGLPGFSLIIPLCCFRRAFAPPVPFAKRLISPSPSDLPHPVQLPPLLPSSDCCNKTLPWSIYLVKHSPTQAAFLSLFNLFTVSLH